MMSKINSCAILTCFMLVMQIFPSGIRAQSVLDRDTLFAAAGEIIKETVYCALATIDSSGQPDVRTMNPFPPSGDWITWFATSRNSKKVREIRSNPKVCVYYADHNSAKGYVAINGTAEIIDDKALLISKKRDYWDGIRGWQDNFVLIRIVPSTMEVINYKHKLYNDPVTLRAPTIEF